MRVLKTRRKLASMIRQFSKIKNLSSHTLLNPNCPRYPA